LGLLWRDRRVALISTVGSRSSCSACWSPVLQYEELAAENAELRAGGLATSGRGRGAAPGSWGAPARTPRSHHRRTRRSPSRRPRPLRRKGGRKPGGQQGHPGRRWPRSPIQTSGCGTSRARAPGAARTCAARARGALTGSLNTREEARKVICQMGRGLL